MSETRRADYKHAQAASFIFLAFVSLCLCGEIQAPFPLQIAKDDFQPNILDCSGLVEAPTGKHGFVTAKGDRFVFEDGAPVRFFGSQMNTLPKAQLDYTARRMRRQGINITRLHGLEFLNDRNGKTSFDYSESGWDRLDYLIYKLGENGIYIILDVDYPLIFPFKAGDNIPGLPKGGPASYAEFFNPKVASIMHQRMRDVFTHVNPYTKKRYADDPTLAMVEVMNEDSLFWGNVQEPFRAELEDQFQQWLRKKYRDNAGLLQAWTVAGKSPLAPGEGLDAGQRIPLYRNTDFTERRIQENPERRVRGQDQLRFCLELEEQYWSASREVMRKAGVRVPIAGTNWQGHGFPTRVHMLGQSKFNYVDRHGYWDHPQGEGNLRWRICDRQFPQPADGEGRRSCTGHHRLPGCGKPGYRESLGADPRPSAHRQRMEHLPAERVLARRHRADDGLRPPARLGWVHAVRLFQPRFPRPSWHRFL